MNDAIFIISNAIVCSKSLSIYNTDERYEQTLKTIDSIDSYCPYSDKIMFDASVIKPDEKYFKGINEKRVNILYTGQDEYVNLMSKSGAKSPAESISFLLSLNWIKQMGIKSKRIYKISGRYRLNDNFVPGYEHVGKYVFTIPTKTWMTQDRIEQTGVDHVYQSRLFHFDFELLDQIIEIMPNVINDCLSLNIDIEHAYYKNFKKYSPVEIEKIGLCGNLAPNGEYIDE